MTKTELLNWTVKFVEAVENRNKARGWAVTGTRKTYEDLLTEFKEVIYPEYLEIKNVEATKILEAAEGVQVNTKVAAKTSKNKSGEGPKATE
jgi:hypothetical protein